MKGKLNSTDVLEALTDVNVLLNGEIFVACSEAEVMIESWRQHFNTVRPHSLLGYTPSAPDTILPSSGTVPPWLGASASPGACPASPTLAL